MWRTKKFPEKSLGGLIFKHMYDMFTRGKHVHSVLSYNVYAPNFEKVDGAYCFWSVRGCVGGCVTLFVPTVTFKPLKLES